VESFVGAAAAEMSTMFAASIVQVQSISAWSRALANSTTVPQARRSVQRVITMPAVQQVITMAWNG